MQLRWRPTGIEKSIRIPAPHKSGNRSVLCFGLAKAGSTMMYNVVNQLSDPAGLTYVSVSDILFSSGEWSPERPTNVGQVYAPRGYCFGGYREFPAHAVPILDTAPTVLLVRDPRDMIVSLFFSIRGSHVAPKGSDGEAMEKFEAERARVRALTISSFLESALLQVRRIFEGYVAQGFHYRPNVAMFRYEDIIFEKKAFVDDLCSWYGWSIDEKIRSEVVQSVDVVPNAERPDEHVRQVRPGNYKQHLNEAQAAHVTACMREYMRLFGYE